MAILSMSMSTLGFEVTLKNQRIRLIGIDSSEIRTRDPEEKEKGLAARGFVEALLPVGSRHVLLSRDCDLPTVALPYKNIVALYLGTRATITAQHVHERGFQCAVQDLGALPTNHFRLTHTELRPFPTNARIRPADGDVRRFLWIGVPQTYRL